MCSVFGQTCRLTKCTLHRHCDSVNSVLKLNKNCTVLYWLFQWVTAKRTGTQGHTRPLPNPYLDHKLNSTTLSLNPVTVEWEVMMSTTSFSNVRTIMNSGNFLEQAGRWLWSASQLTAHFCISVLIKQQNNKNIISEKTFSEGYVPQCLSSSSVYGPQQCLLWQWRVTTLWNLVHWDHNRSSSSSS